MLIREERRAGQGPQGRGKGIGLRSSLRFIERILGPEGLTRVLEGLDRRDLPGPSGYLAASYYDLRIVDHVWRRFGEIMSPNHDLEALDTVFRQLGAFVAEDNLRTVYKLTLAALGPDALFARLPSIWENYFEAPRAQIVARGADRGRIRVSGVTGLSFIAPAAAGWTVFAFGRAGAPAITVRESTWDAGQVRSSTLSFDLAWDEPT